ncbi:hypothetical protein [Aeromonas hydrophila]|uniref:hypothetical protein n=1 Tax=Aeromonas hydrophila TaxID=644 RepID=UPI003D204792
MEVVIPDGKSGEWRVESFTISEQESKMTMIRAMASGRPDEYAPAGEYKRLMRGSVVVMSNTPMEIRTNVDFIQRATGRVLINGLGLGMVLTAILKKPDVTSVTVVEASEDVIRLVAPSFADDPRVTITHSCAFQYTPEQGDRFDAVWHDIWDYIMASNLYQMNQLHDKYRAISSWQGSWARRECEAMREEELSYHGL